MVAWWLHVDEVDHDQAAEVTDTQLTCDFIGRLEVGVQGRFLDIAALGRTGRIDIDGE